jgi:oxygen-dependent protoporphyrinogen oxidase
MTSPPAPIATAIVGGGISGLTAAFRLHQRGIPFALLEESARWGGVVRTESQDGFLMEAGPDSLLAQKPDALELCRELGLGNRLVPTNQTQRAVYVLHHGRLHPLPEGMFLAVPTRLWPFAASGLFSWHGKLRMGLDLLRPARRGSHDESIAAFLGRRFGRECVERLGEPLLAGIHAGDPDRLSMRATFPRFVELEARHGSLIRGLLAARPARAAKGSPPAAFYSLRGGLVDLVDALAARLPPHAVRRERAVVRLHYEDGAFSLGLAGGECLRARSVVLALPTVRAGRLLATLLPDAGSVLERVPQASTATVLLGYRRQDVDHPLDGYGLLVPRREGLRTTACSFFSTKFPGRAPEGHVLLRGFVGGAREPEVLALDDAALVAAVCGEMTPVLGLRGAPVLTRVFRWPQATPQLEVGHLGRIAEVERRVAELPGLFLTGAGLRVTGIPDCVAEATRAAAAAAAWLGVRAGGSD